MHFAQKLLTPALSHTVLLQKVLEFFRQPWLSVGSVAFEQWDPAQHLFLLFSSSSTLLPPPSAVKKESLSSMDKEGDDSSESGESLVIGESFSPLSNNF
jgi:hypothetical protein